MKQPAWQTEALQQRSFGLCTHGTQVGPGLLPVLQAVPNALPWLIGYDASSTHIMTPCVSFKQFHYQCIPSCAASLCMIAICCQPDLCHSSAHLGSPSLSFYKTMEAVFFLMPANKYILKQFQSSLFCGSARQVLLGEVIPFRSSCISVRREETRQALCLQGTQQPFRLRTIPFHFSLIILIS